MSDELKTKDEIRRKECAIEGRSSQFSCESTAFVLDISSSMGGNKIQTLKGALRRDLQNKMMSDTFAEDQTGIITFPSVDNWGNEDVEVEVTHVKPDAHDTIAKKSAVEDFFGIKDADIPRSYGYREKRKHYGNDRNNTPNKYDASVVCKLGRASMDMADKVDKIDPYGCTPMCDGMKAGIKMLDEGAEGIARMVIIGDGEPCAGYLGSDLEGHVKLAEEAHKEFGIFIDTCFISVGSGRRNFKACEFMRRLAKAGGGTFVEICNLGDFDKYLDGRTAERRNLIGKGILLLPGS